MKYIIASLALVLGAASLSAASYFEGMASWYGPKFAGKRTASGEIFDPNKLTAAHKTLPFGTKVRVKHRDHSVVVRINDRGPYSHGRVIDLSRAAAEKIKLKKRGVGRVSVNVL